MFLESECMELKSIVTGDICKEVIAFANTRGGTIYIGVADDGSIHGVESADRTIQQVSNMVRDSIKPDVTMFVRYEAQRIEGKQIVAAIVQKGTERPYYLAGKGLKPSGVYVRNGTSADPATDAAIRMMIKDTDGDSFEAMRALEQKLTFRTAEAQFAKRNLPFDMAKMQTLGMISKDGIYSNLAMLLSDQCSVSVKAATFSGTDKSAFQDRREFRGSLFAQMDEIYAYLDMRNQTKAAFSGMYRTDMRDYPEEALREALMNALVHREYSLGANTLISVYRDRIEFVSVGGLFGGITLEDVKLGLSICRNPKLAAVFYRLQLIEAYGTGVPKIIQSYADSSLTPTFEATANAFRITLPNRNADKRPIAVEVSNESEEGRVLAYIDAHGAITRSEAEGLLGISQTTAYRLLKRMTDNGTLASSASGRRRQYKKK